MKRIYVLKCPSEQLTENQLKLQSFLILSEEDRDIASTFAKQSPER